MQGPAGMSCEWLNGKLHVWDSWVCWITGLWSDAEGCGLFASLVCGNNEVQRSLIEDASPCSMAPLCKYLFHFHLPPTSRENITYVD